MFGIPLKGVVQSSHEDVRSYKLITLVTAEDFEKEINMWIKAGWQPLGGPMTFSAHGLVQALVSYTR